MKTLQRLAARWRRNLVLTPEQAAHLATIKFPCC
jgi:hypothetical protein